MKPFLIPLPIFYVALFMAMNVTASFPIPGSEPIPDWVVEQERFKNRIFEIITLPGKTLGPNVGFYVAPLIWASLLSLLTFLIWRFAGAKLGNKPAEQASDGKPDHAPS